MDQKQIEKIIKIYLNDLSNERFDLLYFARTNPVTQNVPMDIFGLTPKEYHQASSLSIAGEIKETGKTIIY